MTTSVAAPPQRSVRRVSSIAASEQDMASEFGPIVVVPPHNTANSDSHEIAESMELARHKLGQFRTATSSPGSPSSESETLVTDKFAFAFDIDGVLIRGGKAIPAAIEAMKMLNGQNEYGIKV